MKRGKKKGKRPFTKTGFHQRKINSDFPPHPPPSRFFSFWWEWSEKLHFRSCQSCILFWFPVWPSVKNCSSLTAHSNYSRPLSHAGIQQPWSVCLPQTAVWWSRTPGYLSSRVGSVRSKIMSSSERQVTLSTVLSQTLKDFQMSVSAFLSPLPPGHQHHLQNGGCARRRHISCPTTLSLFPDICLHSLSLLFSFPEILFTWLWRWASCGHPQGHTHPRQSAFCSVYPHIISTQMYCSSAVLEKKLLSFNSQSIKRGNSYFPTLQTKAITIFATFKATMGIESHWNRPNVKHSSFCIPFPLLGSS